MALHGNKPIRLLSHGGRTQTRVGAGGGGGARRVAVTHSSTRASGAVDRQGLRKLRLARLRRLRQERMRLMSTTTLPPTTTTTTTAAAPVESTTSWYNPWGIEEGQSSTGDYEYKIDDY